MQTGSLIAVVGTGTTGTEIAYAAVRGGDRVILHDTSERALRLAVAQISRKLDRAVQQGTVAAYFARKAKRSLVLTTELKRCAPADFVIEAIPDLLTLKQSLFQGLEKLISPQAILASTTDTLSVTRISAVLRAPGRIIGLHYVRPLNSTGLIEVVRTPNTHPETVDQVLALLERMGSTPLVVADSPGQVINRLAQAYFGEALAILDHGGIDVPTIDRLMEAAGFTLGPFRRMDEVGVDRAFEVARAMHEATFHATPYRPHARQQRLVEAGRTGHHSSRGGFYPKE